MARLNVCHFIGNITRDPVLKYLSSQTPCCELGIALNESFKRADGEKVERTTFIDCAAFGAQAETLHQYAKKGSPIYLQGHIKQDTWEKDGETRSKLSLVIDDFQLLHRGPQQDAKGMKK